MAEKVVSASTAAVTSVPAPAATPKKAVKSVKSKVLKATHPPTAEMVIAAITALKERGGSSLRAIKKYIAVTYKLDTERLSTFIKKYIKAAVVSGALVQTKGKGATGSFKLPVGKTEATKTKKTATKPVAKKAASPKKSTTVKKPAAKKAVTDKAAPKKAVAAKKAPGTKKSAEKPKKTVKSVASKTEKNPTKAKKASKAPTTKPKAPKPKKIAAPKTAKKVAAAKK